MAHSLNDIAYCVEYFYAKPGCREQLIESLLKLVPLSKAEIGCLQYDLMQDNKNPDLIILLVKFENIQMLRQHENQNFIKEFSENEMKKYCEKLIWNDARGLSFPIYERGSRDFFQ